MIVITAPTGQIGSRVLENVLGENALGGDGGEPIRVIARDPSRLPARVRERVEVVTGSHGDAEVVNRAFAGADMVFWLVAADPRAESAEAAYVDFSRPACEAFTRQGVKRVVGISALGRGVPGPAGYAEAPGHTGLAGPARRAGHAGHVSASLAMDDLIAATGVDFRALTMPSFMDNALRQVDGIKNQGVYLWPIRADLKAPTCAVRDIAAVAARLLLDRSWTGQSEVPVLGPEDLSGDDMAQIISEVLGKTVRYQQVPADDFKAALLGRGMSEAMAQSMVDMTTAKNNGLDNAEPRTPQSTTPTTFRQWCEEVLKPAVLA